MNPDQTDYRQWLVQAHHTATRDFDRAVTVLAAGALGLSITFVHDIAPNPVHEGWLGVAWGFFVGALVATFVSLLTSQGVLVKRIVDHDAGREWGRSLLGIATTILNVLAATGIVGGFICLVIFALYNL